MHGQQQQQARRTLHDRPRGQVLAAEPGREILVRLVQRLQQLRVVGGRAVRGPALGLVERGGKLVDVSAGAVLTQLQVRLREQGLLLAKASAQAFERSEARSVGKAVVSKGRSRGSQYH